MNATTSQLLLDAREVAELLGVESKTIFRMSQRGDFPLPIKVGRLRKWSRRAVENWIEKSQPSETV